MNPEKWQLIRRIFHEAVELPQGERGLFVSRAADGDEFLRIEVESLLAFHDSAASFIESPGDQVTAYGYELALACADLADTLKQSAAGVGRDLPGKTDRLNEALANYRRSLDLMIKLKEQAALPKPGVSRLEEVSREINVVQATLKK